MGAGVDLEKVSGVSPKKLLGMCPKKMLGMCPKKVGSSWWVPGASVCECGLVCLSAPHNSA